MKKQTEWILIIAILGLVDIFIPIPILAILLIYGILGRPKWFMDILDDLNQNR